MMVWLLFIIDLMGLFFYNKIGSIISIGDLPTTNIIEPKKLKEVGLYFLQLFCITNSETMNKILFISRGILLLIYKLLELFLIVE